MQDALLPSRICQEIDRANRNFLQGSTSEKRKMYMVIQDIVTLPTDHGGLDIHAAQPRNLSLLAKLDCKLSLGENMSWAKVLKAKYMSSCIKCSPWLSKGSCSRTWATCKAAKPLLDLGLRKVISLGSSTSFWSDNQAFFGTFWYVLLDSLCQDQCS